MNESETTAWTTKLAAWLHDPAEKALILMRSQHRHDEGSVAELREHLLGSRDLDSETLKILKAADRWASAGDRPDFPRPKEERYFAQDVAFWRREHGGELVHPLSGDRYRPGDLYVDRAGRIEQASLEHFLRLGNLSEPIDGEDEAARLRRVFLTMWRLGPESDPPDLGLGALWRVLPADTRIPDHSIWEHLSLASAFAGAMAADRRRRPALLKLSIGPVQGFIEQARSTSDLWAGSHLLAFLSWAAMRPVVEALGPDAVLFPSLWGVPLVDVWLEKQMGVRFPAGGDRDAPEWKRFASDANPLFAPTLPNAFLALVPAERARALAEQATAQARACARELAADAACAVLEEAGLDRDALPDLHLSRQLSDQLAGFPEVAWSVAAWPEPSTSLRELTGAMTGELREHLEALTDGGGFLDSEAWNVVGTAVEMPGEQGESADDPFFYRPNPGVLYPAVYEVCERGHAAAKAARAFKRSDQHGYRCSLCGEREWLTEERTRLDLPPGRRGNGDGRAATLWSQLGDGAVARKGEHLCAWCTLKRLWPRLFVDWVKEHATGFDDRGLHRFVVSTHTMAMASDLERLLEGHAEDAGAAADLARRCEDGSPRRAALPRRLAEACDRRGPSGSDAAAIARHLPSRLDELREDEEGTDPNAARRADEDRRELESLFKKALGHRPEAYYGLLLMDGDSMGRWVAGDPELALAYRDTWHPEVAKGVETRFARNTAVKDYLGCHRAQSPARHAAISSALNGFSGTVARWVVEELFRGKLLYAGGDDVMAMVPVEDLLPCLLMLRCAYSGVVPAGEKASIWRLYGEVKDRIAWVDRGHVLLGGNGGRLLRMMGGRATASAGAVLAHHTAPLQAVLRELRTAERRAKLHGRNAFSLSLMKRAGGTSHLTASWGFGGVARSGDGDLRDVPYRADRWSEDTGELRTPMGVLFELRDVLAADGVSRRAAYNALQWLPGMPDRPGEALGEDELGSLLTSSLGAQLERQGVRKDVLAKAGIATEDPARRLAGTLTAVAFGQCRPPNEGGEWANVTGFIGSLLNVAEFLAREGRARSAPSHAAEVGPAAAGGGS